jgi:hypothetical protein
MADSIAAINPIERPFHYVQVQPDGSLLGHVSTIDPNTLLLRPVPDATVTLIQNGRVTAEARTGADGRFVVRRITPRAVYSVFAASPRYFATFSFAVVSRVLSAAATEAPLEDGAQANTFVIQQQPPLDDQTQHTVADELHIAAIPIEDLRVAPPIAPPFAGMPRGMGGGSGGGGGGGGGFPIPIPIPFGNDGEGVPFASPFVP